MSHDDLRGRRPADARGFADQLPELGRALERETELVRALGEALLRQRSGVADSDDQDLHAGTNRIGELITALQQARVRRERLLAAVGADASLPLSRLETVLRRPLPASVDRARAQLARAAGEADRELAINRTVLHRALENGEAFFHALFSLLGREIPSYDKPRARTARTSRTAVLVNKVG